MREKKIDVIAIDGPAASGKSTTARLVAQKLGFTYLDTGAMYRAFTLKVLRKKINVRDELKILSLANNTKIELKISNGQLEIILDGEGITPDIRRQDVANNVSIVASYTGVRKWMVQQQRKIGLAGKLVAEGRDIGTVVFPNARLKIFLVASVAERAKRRQQEMCPEESIPLKKMIKQLKKRDDTDRTRATGPLKQADDAIELDTTNLTIEQQVNFIVDQWNKIIQFNS